MIGAIYDLLSSPGSLSFPKSLLTDFEQGREVSIGAIRFVYRGKQFYALLNRELRRRSRSDFSRILIDFYTETRASLTSICCILN